MRRAVALVGAPVLVALVGMGCGETLERPAANESDAAVDVPDDAAAGDAPDIPDAEADAGLTPGTTVSASCIQVMSGYGTTGTTPLKVETVTDGLEQPWGIGFISATEFLVTERAGRIRRIVDGVLAPTPVLSLSVDAYEAGGLLSLALAPDFAMTRRFFVYANVLVDGKHVSQVIRLVLAPDGLSATVDQVVLGIPRFHNGGRLRFGPDGMLYVGTGDDAAHVLAQNPTSPEGKILRIAPDGTFPPDNPWPNSPVFVIGLRNPQAFDWLDDGSMVVLDNGPSGELGRTGQDEVNLLPPDAGGANLGWPDIHGCEIATSDPSLRAPLLTWAEAVPPSGGSIYRGAAIPQFQGNLLFTSLRSEHLHRVVFDPATHLVASHEVYFAGDPPNGYGRLRGGLVGPDGWFYVLTGNCDAVATCALSDRMLRIAAK